MSQNVAARRGCIHCGLTGGGGADTLIGRGGPTTFVYNAASDSTGINFDTIYSPFFANDKFDVLGTITAVDTAITAGTVYAGSFDANLTTYVDAAHLGAHHAVLFMPSGGTYAGHTFLIVDENGTAGYQAGQDLVIQLITPTGTLTTEDFI